MGAAREILFLIRYLYLLISRSQDTFLASECRNVYIVCKDA